MSWDRDQVLYWISLLLTQISNNSLCYLPYSTNVPNITLLNQWQVMLNNSKAPFYVQLCFTVDTMTWFSVMEYLCHTWPRLCSTCRKHFPVVSSFLTYHRIYMPYVRRVWRYQKENQTKERSNNCTYQIKDRVKRTRLKTGCELRFSGELSRVHATLVAPVVFI
jgi:hypothetical protein